MVTRQAVETHLAFAHVGKVVRAVQSADDLIDGSVGQVVSEAAKLGLALAQRLLCASALRDVDEGDASRGRTLPLHDGGGGLDPEPAPVLPEHLYFVRGRHALSAQSSVDARQDGLAQVRGEMSRY